MKIHSEIVLQNLLSYLVKKEDCPMSASTHFNTAIYVLFKLCERDLDSYPEDAKVFLKEAIEELNLLGISNSL